MAHNLREVSMYHLRLCFISTHTFWPHKTRQDTFYFTSFMDFISFHAWFTCFNFNLSVLLSFIWLISIYQYIYIFTTYIYYFYIIYNQFQFIYTFTCSIQIFYMFYVLYYLIYMITFISFQPRIYIFYVCLILFKICLAHLIW